MFDQSSISDPQYGDGEDSNHLAAPIQLYLHRYSGKESGLMILGSRESLKRLAGRINDALGPEAKVSPVYPGFVAKCQAEGLERDARDFELSFHVDTEPPFRPKARQTALVSSLIFILALIGAISLTRALIHLVV